MHTLQILVFTVLSAAPFSATSDDLDKQCPSGLPTELLLDCHAAIRAAVSDESGLNEFGDEQYNLVEKLQEWMDVQMRADVPRNDIAEPNASDVAQQQDEH